jgi:hypothetical protein
MKRYQCTCGNGLFFENSTCVNCKRDVGWCPTCRRIVPLDKGPDGLLVCGQPDCAAPVLKCRNYAEQNVCNRCVPREGKVGPALCDYCRFNHVIPDLTIPVNKSRWARIERAKRRALYDFDFLGLPYGTAADGVSPPLKFDFKTDAKDPALKKYRPVDNGEQVMTGHDNGVVTINLREADPVEREKARIAFGEAHRTLVGHFRHEMGHYVWDVAIKGKKEPACAALFGDHTVPYDEALKAYYANGPKPNWPEAYVSGYATMHAWEDWAETFANYLDLVATLDTAENGALVPQLDWADFDAMASTYATLGVSLNELNRGIGLIDFLPEILVGPVRHKMAFIHALTKVAGGTSPPVEEKEPVESATDRK